MYKQTVHASAICSCQNKQIIPLPFNSACKTKQIEETIEEGEALKDENFLITRQT